MKLIYSFVFVLSLFHLRGQQDSVYLSHGERGVYLMYNTDTLQGFGFRVDILDSRAQGSTVEVILKSPLIYSYEKFTLGDCKWWKRTIFQSIHPVMRSGAVPKNYENLTIPNEKTFSIRTDENIEFVTTKGDVKVIKIKHY